MYELMAAIVVLIVIIVSMVAPSLGWMDSNLGGGYSFKEKYVICWKRGIGLLCIIIVGASAIVCVFMGLLWSVGVIGRYLF